MDTTEHPTGRTVADSPTKTRTNPHERMPQHPGRAAALVAVASALLLSILGTVWIVRGERNPLDNAQVLFGSALTQYPNGLANGIFLSGVLVALAGSLWLTLVPVSRHNKRDPALWVSAVSIAALIALMDSSVMTSIGYLPLMIAGPFLGITEVEWSMFLSVPLGLQLVLLIVVASIGGAMAGRIRRRRQATDITGQVLDLARATKRTRRWAKIAMEAPLVYALTRVLMFFCVPGFDLAPFGAPILWAGLGLALSAAVGALLTWGLIRPWGVRFPRWMLWMAGRRVPISFAVISGLTVAVMVAATSRSILLQSLGITPDSMHALMEWPLIVLPMLLWPLWALALALATINYGIRRRLTDALGRETPSRTASTVSVVSGEAS